MIGRELEAFLKDTRAHSRWLEKDDLRIYVRKGWHLDENQKLIQTLDIGNAYCFRPGEGRFTRFLEKMEEISPYPIYVQSVLNLRLRGFLEKRGYALIPDQYPDYNYIKELGGAGGKK